MDLMASYANSILALGVFGLVYLLQLVVADLAGIFAHRVPGSPLEGGHDDFLFRAIRTHANTTESVGILLLLALFAMLAGGDPFWTARVLWVFVLLRVLHAAFYYLNFPLVRGGMFLASLLALATLFGIGVAAF